MTDKRKTITLRLDEDLHRAIRLKVARDDTNMTSYLIGLVKDDLKKE